MSDLRQIGPNRERDISGVCSACGATLLAWLDNGENVTPTLLRAKLEQVFERHVAERHSESGKAPKSIRR